VRCPLKGLQRAADDAAAGLHPPDLVIDVLSGEKRGQLLVTDRYLRDVAPTHVIDTMRARRWDST